MTWLIGFAVIVLFIGTGLLSQQMSRQSARKYRNHNQRWRF